MTLTSTARLNLFLAQNSRSDLRNRPTDGSERLRLEHRRHEHRSAGTSRGVYDYVYVYVCSGAMDRVARCEAVCDTTRSVCGPCPAITVTVVSGGVRARAKGRHRPSAARWTLVVNPPRERPRPSPIWPPPPAGGRLRSLGSAWFAPRPPLFEAVRQADLSSRRRHAGEPAPLFSPPPPCLGPASCSTRSQEGGYPPCRASQFRVHPVVHQTPLRRKAWSTR